MGQSWDETTRNLAERVYWQVAHRDAPRVARHLDRRQGMDRVYRLDADAWLEDCLHCLPAIGMMALVEQACGTAVPRERLPFMQSVLL